MYFDCTTRNFAAIEVAPDAPAVIARERCLTWRELHTEAQAWCRRAGEFGLARDLPIMIRGHKEASFMVALCGALMLGAPFVPLDTLYPAQRVNGIAAALEATLLYDAGTDCFEVLRAGPPRALQERDLAYIMFTSGTTGVPKGVQIGIEGVCALSAWMDTDFGLGPTPVFLNQAAFSFDLSMYSVFGALGSGGAIVLLDRTAAAVALEVAALIAQHAVTVWVSTPSFAQQQLLNPGFTAAALPSLRTLLFCGEPLPTPLARQLRQRFPGVPILNTYGPTEATVATTLLALEESHLAGDGGVLPIGRPKRDSLVYCDDGELCIVGAHVMRGYLNRADLNQSRMFLRNGQRGFRTGDLGSVDASGMLYCHGRSDDQIKLNGYRMELLEIDAALGALPGNRPAASVPLRRPNGTVARLVAYVETGTPDAVLPVELAQWKTLLAQRLPAYMIPSELRGCIRLPVSLNYKIDREQLAQAYRNGTAP